MTDTATNYLGRCKGCDYALFATPESIVQADNAVAGGPAVNVGNGQIMGRCTNGHRWFMLRRVEGTYSESHKCDSRCLNAKGHSCTCSCGGANHGRGYAVEAVQVRPSGEVAVQGATMRETYDAVQGKVDQPNPHGYTSAAERQAGDRAYREQAEAATVTLPTEGETFTATVRCTHVQHNVGSYNSTLFLFVTSKGTTLKWFAPDYLSNFCDKGESVRVTAKVKRVGEYNGSPEVVITYVERATAQEG